MKYKIWIHEQRLESLHGYMPNAVVLDTDKDLVQVEIEIKHDMDLMQLFYAGIDYAQKYTRRAVA